MSLPDPRLLYICSYNPPNEYSISMDEYTQLRRFMDAVIQPMTSANINALIGVLKKHEITGNKLLDFVKNSCFNSVDLARHAMLEWYDYVNKDKYPMNNGRAFELLQYFARMLISNTQKTTEENYKELMEIL